MKEKAIRKLANGQNIDYSEKEIGPRASSAPALGLNTIIFKHVYQGICCRSQVSVYRTIGPLVCSICWQNSMVFRRLSTLQKLKEVYVSIKMLVRNSTSTHRMKQRFFIIQCSCRNEFTNLIKISLCWLNKIQAMQDH